MLDLDIPTVTSIFCSRADLEHTTEPVLYTVRASNQFAIVGSTLAAAGQHLHPSAWALTMLSFPNLPRSHQGSHTNPGMVSLATLASSLFAVALLATAAAKKPGTGKWSETTVSAADSELLYATLADENAYNPIIEDFICVRVVEGLQTQTATSSKHVRQADSARYKFAVGGCRVRKEYGGRCFESYFYPECGNFEVVISPDAKTGDYAVKSIAVHKVKSKH